ncbi:hypothetical protein QL285_018654 [Trifolium repens]|nr:hypothetical protein QL285_018654 [Trifolium repens]
MNIKNPHQQQNTMIYNVERNQDCISAELATQPLWDANSRNKGESSRNHYHKKRNFVSPSQRHSSRRRVPFAL